ncbi:mechanosensitive ion channel [Halorubrum persicum]|uniref:mechanosensitive ion channel n=1 Tax=Halorubrum persicum TaxID=1383844 RepID=UPI00118184B6
MNQPAPQALPVRFADSAVVLELRFWIDSPMPQRKWRAIQNVIHNVKSAFREEGIKILFPQQDVINFMIETWLGTRSVRTLDPAEDP